MYENYRASTSPSPCRFVGFLIIEEQGMELHIAQPSPRIVSWLCLLCPVQLHHQKPALLVEEVLSLWVAIANTRLCAAGVFARLSENTRAAMYVVKTIEEIDQLVLHGAYAEGISGGRSKRKTGSLSMQPDLKNSHAG